MCGGYSTTFTLMETPSQKAGYHVTPITKGILGESSKLREEIEELIDAEKQGCKVMALLELADLVGAIDMYLEKNAPTFSVEDLIKMSKITKRAFVHGHRK